MIAWDPVNEAIIPFGSLKTAALAEKENRSSEDGIRPLCKVFPETIADDRYHIRYSLY